jgi:hypothetical protein
VQHFGPEDFSRCEPVKAFSRGVVVSLDARAKACWGEKDKVGLARKKPAHPSDGILDAALLPGGVGVAEEGLEPDLVQLEMARELGAVVEGNGLAQRFG